MAVTAALWFRRWWLLPVLAVFGAAAKETFVLWSAALAVGWLIATWSQPDRWRRAAWIGAMSGAGFVTTTALLSWNRGGMFWPWDLAASMAVGSSAPTNLLAGLVGAVFNHGVVAAFAWLLPLGIWRLRRLPREWITGVALAGAAVLAICALGDARSNTGRIAFTVAGPLLCLSAATLLADRSHGWLRRRPYRMKVPALDVE
jgi:hypothetical protein